MKKEKYEKPKLVDFSGRMAQGQACLSVGNGDIPSGCVTGLDEIVSSCPSTGQGFAEQICPTVGSTNSPPPPPTGCTSGYCDMTCSTGSVPGTSCSSGTFA